MKRQRGDDEPAGGRGGDGGMAVDEGGSVAAALQTLRLPQRLLLYAVVGSAPTRAERSPVTAAAAEATLVAKGHCPPSVDADARVAELAAVVDGTAPRDERAGDEEAGAAADGGDGSPEAVTVAELAGASDRVVLWSSEAAARAFQHVAGMSRGTRVVEVQATSPLLLISADGTLSEAEAARELSRRADCGGWTLRDGVICLVEDSAEILRLVDDDKRPRLAQAFLTDMFASLSLGGGGGGGAEA